MLYQSLGRGRRNCRKTHYHKATNTWQRLHSMFRLVLERDNTVAIETAPFLGQEYSQHLVFTDLAKAMSSLCTIAGAVLSLISCQKVIRSFQ